MTPPWFLAAVAGLGLLRLAELAYAARNDRLLVSRGAVPVRPDGMLALVAVHVAFFAGVLAESWWAPGAGPTTFPVGLGLFLLGWTLRLWSMATLRWRWSTRVFVLRDAPRLRRGPYRILPHPIYFGVFLELTGFALLDTLWWTAAAVGIANAAALRHRIRIEETAWQDIDEGPG